MPQLVVITEQLLATVPGGTGRYTRELTGALARTAPPRWRVTTVVARHRDSTGTLAAIPGVDGPRVLPLSPRALVAAWDRGLPLWPGGDSVHAPTPLAPPRPNRGRSLVVTVHDAVPWTHPHTLTERGVRWHQRAVTRAAKRASALVVPTGAVAAELSRYALPAGRVHIVGEGVTPELRAVPDPPAAAAIAERLRLPPRYLLIVGTLEPRKGLDVLLDAMTRPHAPALPLVVVGQPGWGAVHPMRLADQAGLDRARVLALGRISDEELAVVLDRAAVLVAPSLAEGFGLPVLEAMAAGVPVVHSDAPALIEVAGGTGVTVKRQDATALANGLRTVFDFPERTAARVAAGRLRAQRFTWERAARAVWRIHVELYQTAGRA
ncbi:MAG TPA: glycosyltransferase family 1 protein [Pseudonocardiaceae bacterium]